MEEELKEEEGAVPRYTGFLSDINEHSYLEGVTAPDGPIVERPEGDMPRLQRRQLIHRR